MLLQFASPPQASSPQASVTNSGKDSSIPPPLSSCPDCRPTYQLSPCPRVFKSPGINFFLSQRSFQKEDLDSLFPSPVLISLCLSGPPLIRLPAWPPVAESDLEELA